MRQGLELTTANEVQAAVGEDSVVLPLRAAWGGGLGGSLRVFIKCFCCVSPVVSPVLFLSDSVAV